MSLTLAAATLFSAETPSSSTRALAAVAALCSLYDTSPACRALISALFAVAFSALNPSVTTWRKQIGDQTIDQRKLRVPAKLIG